MLPGARGRVRRPTLLGEADFGLFREVKKALKAFIYMAFSAFV